MVQWRELCAKCHDTLAFYARGVYGQWKILAFNLSLYYNKQEDKVWASGYKKSSTCLNTSHFLLFFSRRDIIFGKFTFLYIISALVSRKYFSTRNQPLRKEEEIVWWHGVFDGTSCLFIEAAVISKLFLSQWLPQSAAGLTSSSSINTYSN